MELLEAISFQIGENLTFFQESKRIICIMPASEIWRFARKREKNDFQNPLSVFWRFQWLYFTSQVT